MSDLMREIGDNEAFLKSTKKKVSDMEYFDHEFKLLQTTYFKEWIKFRDEMHAKLKALSDIVNKYSSTEYIKLQKKLSQLEMKVKQLEASR